MNSRPNRDNITALILAGGKGRRLGGMDKGTIEFNGKPLIEHVIKALRNQVYDIFINANRHLDEYSSTSYQVIRDELEGYQGPLAGYATGLKAINTPYMVVVPCDGPWIAHDLVVRLCTALESESAEVSVAHDGQRMQPVYCLLNKSLLPSLEAFLAGGGRKIDQWYALHSIALADFSDNPECFSNINTHQDYMEMQHQTTTA